MFWRCTLYITFHPPTTILPHGCIVLLSIILLLLLLLLLVKKFIIKNLYKSKKMFTKISQYSQTYWETTICMFTCTWHNSRPKMQSFWRNNPSISVNIAKSCINFLCDPGFFVWRIWLFVNVHGHLAFGAFYRTTTRLLINPFYETIIHLFSVLSSQCKSEKVVSHNGQDCFPHSIACLKCVSWIHKKYDWF